MKQRHRRKLRSSKRSIGNQPITLYRQRIPPSRFKALTEEHQYCLLVLGHIHDELSWLQRMAVLTSRPHQFKNEVERQGGVMQVTMLARLLFGKLFEFQVLLSPQQSPIRRFISEFYRPSEPAASAARVDKILAQFETESWIRVGRNKHFMHYPSLNDVRETLNDPKIEWLLEVFHGKLSSNTFYPTSDVLANYAWFRLVNPDEPMKGLDEALSMLRSITSTTLQTLEQSIGYFIDVRLMPLSENERVRLNVPSIHDQRLPYFVAA